MKSSAFTHTYYLQLLDLLKKSKRPMMGVAEFLQTPSQQAVILRHDVDRCPLQAVRMSRIEAAFGVKSTYYFRWHKQQGFHETAVKLIANLGHEVGYHYETLSQTQGKKAEAIALFEANLKLFRQLAPCDTVSAHGAPLSPHNNFDLLLGYAWDRAALVGDAALSLREVPLVYYTDTGGNWNTGRKLNFRDYVGQLPVENVISPVSLVEFLSFLQNCPHPIYISTHPERWAHHLGYLAMAQGKDWLTNVIKLVIHGVSKKR